MGPFAIHDPYPRGVDRPAEGQGESEDFEIDSDVSDTDLLDLKRELNQLGTERAQRDLADATMAYQEMNLDRWKKYSPSLAGPVPAAPLAWQEG